MDSILNVLSNGWNYLLTMRASDIADVLIVAALIYWLIGVIKKTNTSRVATGIVILLLVMWVSGLLRLTMIHSLLQNLLELGLIAIVVLFQPELRRLLERLGSGKFMNLGTAVPTSSESVIAQTVLACTDMASTKTGALIVFERTTLLNDQMGTGTIVNADVTSELLRNIFFVKAPLHDGAVIIREGRIAAAGCMLPLTQNANLSSDLGMRHRAGIGMSEHSDAVVVIVSEETGSISVAIDGMLKRHLSADTFEKILRAELMPDGDEANGRGLVGLINSAKALLVRKNDKKEKEISCSTTGYFGSSLSLLASLVIWMYLNGTQQEEIEIDLRGVEVVFEGADTLQDTREYIIANVDNYSVRRDHPWDEGEYRFTFRLGCPGCHRRLRHNEHGIQQPDLHPSLPGQGRRRRGHARELVALRNRL